METNKSSQWLGRWKLLAVVAVCAAPMIFSYLTYYVIKPTGRTNFGTLIEPQKYPDLLDVNGSPVPPYDVTAHSLALSGRHPPRHH